ncbi:MAG TPA: GDSL-type esterase/lipase family protein [Pirellulales bacterium]
MFHFILFWQGRIETSCWVGAVKTRERRRAPPENLERRELLAGQPPLIADAASYNAAYVNAVYHDALGREANSAALADFTPQLDQGQSRGMVPVAVVQSAEYASDLVQADYQKYLWRLAEPNAVAAWTSLFDAGAQDDVLTATIVASDEFYTRAGGDDAAWIAAAYQAVLGRASDASDLQTVERQLAEHVSRGVVALSIAASPEHEMEVVNAVYQQYLHAAPDATDLSSWAAQLAAHQNTAEALAISLMSGNAYYELATGVPPTVVPVPVALTAWQGRDDQVTAEAAAASSAPIVFIGDSITQGWQLQQGAAVWNQYFAPLNAFDAGVGGDSTESLLWRVEGGQLRGLAPKVVVLMVGINNILPGDSPSDTAAGVAADIAALRQQLPTSKILLLGILPATPPSIYPLMQTIDAVNQSLPTLADGRTVFYLNAGSAFIQADGTLNNSLYQSPPLQLNASGYAALASAIAPQLKSLLA